MPRSGPSKVLPHYRTIYRDEAHAVTYTCKHTIDHLTQTLLFSLRCLRSSWFFPFRLHGLCEKINCGHEPNAPAAP